MSGPGRLVLDSKGDILLAGISAAIGMVHGPVVSICPHKSTGECCRQAEGQHEHTDMHQVLCYVLCRI